ncbi:MAG: deoxyguanosinetriphosphate triphosphohydrolase [Gammaproteobacteria bacterium]|nr:deoxyguanosinetriphosphate triphosphohydrolase [Gammaproteobacteria bacterium]NNM00647.1 deoxyguanosinetriphosphate triphosphohydrolase [Gammaproteobacteria bacterium]
MSVPARYAALPASSRGRRHPEPEHAWRSPYQRDRDRVIHSASFRRLEYKTQVFVNHEGDMFRTRLTHSLEVAQIARTIARALEVDEDLTEAIALAHDLGHTPFGHAGQDALDECMREFGGFEHNLQSLRVVDTLEQRYPDFDGLNLTFEAREGIVKHAPADKALELGSVGARFLHGGSPSLEAQIANVADEIAYNHHDIDDGLRAGLLTIAQLREVPVFARHLAAVTARWPELAEQRARHTAIRAMLNGFVEDVIATSRAAIENSGAASVDDIRAQPRPLVQPSEAMALSHRELKAFLREQLYRHPRVDQMSRQAAARVADLFQAYMHDEATRPATLKPGADEAAKARLVADYIAGMTDRYAIAEHARISVP